MLLIPLCVLSLLLGKGVFGVDPYEVKSVMEGDSVTLHTHLTHIQTDEQILWLFGLQGTRIAEIYYQKPKTYDKTGRYGGRLRINTQTGSLTITNISTTDSGLHELQIINSRGTVFKRFNVSVYGVFGDTVSVNDGWSVTLHNHLTDIQRVELIVWWFNGHRIAKINSAVNSDPAYDPDERFTDRLKMNSQTGDLTITDITSEITGEYKLEIDGESIITKSFIVSLSSKLKIVKERDSVSLHNDVTEEQRNEKIYWKIKHNNSLLAEIITENGTVSRPFIDERFRDRLKLDDQTGDLIIADMKNEDSGQYEADVTIGSITHTIHKTFSFTGSGHSSGLITAVCVSLLLLVIAGAGAVVGVIYRHFKRRNQDPNTGEESL